jgi:YidC/Oxa1 family membrane protein insertase
LSDAKDEKKDLPNKVKWVAYKDQFFSTVLISKQDFSSVILETKMVKEKGYLKQYDLIADVEMNHTEISVEEPASSRTPQETAS